MTKKWSISLYHFVITKLNHVKLLQLLIKHETEKLIIDLCWSINVAIFAGDWQGLLCASGHETIKSKFLLYKILCFLACEYLKHFYHLIITEFYFGDHFLFNATYLLISHSILYSSKHPKFLPNYFGLIIGCCCISPLVLKTVINNNSNKTQLGFWKPFTVLSSI